MKSTKMNPKKIVITAPTLNVGHNKNLLQSSSTISFPPTVSIQVAQPSSVKNNLSIAQPPIFIPVINEEKSCRDIKIPNNKLNETKETQNPTILSTKNDNVKLSKSSALELNGVFNIPENNISIHNKNVKVGIPYQLNVPTKVSQPTSEKRNTKIIKPVFQKIVIDKELLGRNIKICNKKYKIVKMENLKILSNRNKNDDIKPSVSTSEGPSLNSNTQSVSTPKISHDTEDGVILNLNRPQSKCSRSKKKSRIEIPNEILYETNTIPTLQNHLFDTLDIPSGTNETNPTANPSETLKNIRKILNDPLNASIQAVAETELTDINQAIEIEGSIPKSNPLQEDHSYSGQNANVIVKDATSKVVVLSHATMEHPTGLEACPEPEEKAESIVDEEPLSDSNELVQYDSKKYPKPKNCRPDPPLKHCVGHDNMLKLEDEYAVKLGDKFATAEEFKYYVNSHARRWLTAYKNIYSYPRTQYCIPTYSYTCIFAMRYPSAYKKRGLRKRKEVFKTDCPSRITLRRMTGEKTFTVVYLCHHHNHPLTEELFLSHAQFRRLPPDLQEEVRDLMSLDMDIPILKRYIFATTGFKLTIKQLYIESGAVKRKVKGERQFTLDKLKILLEKIRTLRELYGDNETSQKVKVEQSEDQVMSTLSDHQETDVSSKKSRPKKPSKIDLLLNSFKETPTTKRIKQDQTDNSGEAETQRTKGVTKSRKQSSQKRRSNTTVANTNKRSRLEERLENISFDEELLQSVKQLQESVGCSFATESLVPQTNDKEYVIAAETEHCGIAPSVLENYDDQHRLQKQSDNVIESQVFDNKIVIKKDIQKKEYINDAPEEQTELFHEEICEISEQQIDDVTEYVPIEYYHDQTVEKYEQIIEHDESHHIENSDYHLNENGIDQSIDMHYTLHIENCDDQHIETDCDQQIEYIDDQQIVYYDSEQIENHCDQQIEYIDDQQIEYNDDQQIEYNDDQQIEYNDDQQIEGNDDKQIEYNYDQQIEDNDDQKVEYNDDQEIVCYDNQQIEIHDKEIEIDDHQIKEDTAQPTFIHDQVQYEVIGPENIEIDNETIVMYNDEEYVSTLLQNTENNNIVHKPSPRPTVSDMNREKETRDMGVQAEPNKLDLDYLAEDVSSEHDIVFNNGVTYTDKDGPIVVEYISKYNIHEYMIKSEFPKYIEKLANKLGIGLVKLLSMVYNNSAIKVVSKYTTKQKKRNIRLKFLAKAVTGQVMDSTLTEIENYKAQISSHLTVLNVVNERLQAYFAHIVSLTTSLHKLMETNNKLRDENNQLTKTNEPFQDKMKNLKTQCALKDEKNDILTKRNELCQDEIRKLKAECEELKGLRTSAEKYKSELIILTKILLKMEKDLEEQKNINKELQEVIQLQMTKNTSHAINLMKLKTLNKDLSTKLSQYRSECSRSLDETNNEAIERSSVGTDYVRRSICNKDKVKTNPIPNPQCEEMGIGDNLTTIVKSVLSDVTSIQEGLKTMFISSCNNICKSCKKNNSKLLKNIHCLENKTNIMCDKLHAIVSCNMILDKSRKEAILVYDEQETHTEVAKSSSHPTDPVTVTVDHISDEESVNTTEDSAPIYNHDTIFIQDDSDTENNTEVAAPTLQKTSHSTQRIRVKNVTSLMQVSKPLIINLSDDMNETYFEDGSPHESNLVEDLQINTTEEVIIADEIASDKFNIPPYIIEKFGSCDSHKDKYREDDFAVPLGSKFKSKDQFIDQLKQHGKLWFSNYMKLKSNDPENENKLYTFQCSQETLGLAECPCKVVLEESPTTQDLTVVHICNHHNHDWSMQERTMCTSTKCTCLV